MPSHITFLRQLVEVSGDDPVALREASKVTTTLIDVVQDMLALRWSSPFHMAANDLDTSATPFTVFDDPFILPPGTSARETTPFHSSKLPQISLRDYVTRLFKYMRCSAESYVIALILLERYHVGTGLAIEPMNAFRLYLIALGISAKIRDDKFYSNRYYAEVGGITVAEYTALEIKFLFCIKWATHVGLSEYEACERSILHSIANATRIPAFLNILNYSLSPYCRPEECLCESPASSILTVSESQPAPTILGTLCLIIGSTTAFIFLTIFLLLCDNSFFQFASTEDPLLFLFSPDLSLLSHQAFHFIYASSRKAREQ